MALDTLAWCGEDSMIAWGLTKGSLVLCLCFETTPAFPVSPQWEGARPNQYYAAPTPPKFKVKSSLRQFQTSLLTGPVLILPTKYQRMSIQCKYPEFQVLSPHLEGD
jgi:hypothetical protein